MLSEAAIYAATRQSGVWRVLSPAREYCLHDALLAACYRQSQLRTHSGLQLLYLSSWTALAQR